MGSKSVVAGHKNDGDLYGFQDQRNEQITRTRDKWEPTDHSRFCSKQNIIALESYSKLSESLGLGKVKSLLKPHAVPLFEPASLKRKIELTLGEPVKRRLEHSSLCNASIFTS